MEKVNNMGYVLFINLILISLIGLFIPLLIQQQKLNYRILNNRITAAQGKEAVESGLQYQLYYIKNENLLLDEKLILTDNIELRVKGKEDDNYIYLTAKFNSETSYKAEMTLEKESLRIIKKIIYRSD